MDNNRCIGVKGNLPPWHLRDDMAHFKKTTTGNFAETGKKNMVIVGRKTFDFFHKKFKPLPDRTNLIITRNRSFEFAHADCRVIYDMEYAIEMSRTHDVFVIGGGQIYELFLPLVSKMIITHVDTEMEGGDTFFPQTNGEWRTKVLKEFKKDDRNDFDFKIVEYTRRPRL